jgi:hypothetical protein
VFPSSGSKNDDLFSEPYPEKMILLKNCLFLCIICWLASGCQRKVPQNLDEGIFETVPSSTVITKGFIDEVSGISDSRSVSGTLWVEQDSGNPPELTRIDYQGLLSGKVYLKGIENRDWEDISIAGGPLPGVSYIYLADIGDNFSNHQSSFIYRFPEPGPATDTVYAADKIVFHYPEGPADAEAILVDNARDIYIITKSGSKSKIYKLPYPQKLDDSFAAIPVGELSFSGVVSAAMSPDYGNIILKTYDGLQFWKREQGESIEATLSKAYKSLLYEQEAQGEAICFKNDNSGFFTLSEKPALASSVRLFFYRRK